MPELPEVETIVQQLRAQGLEGQTICSVDVHWAPIIAPLSDKQFKHQLCNVSITQVGRNGKWMIFSLDSNQTLLVHLRMAGSFSFSPSLYDRIVLHLSDKRSLYYRDTRKFGRWKLVDHPEEILDKLGPDALTSHFSHSYFRTALSSRKRKIKALILDQSCVAGLGNIYADEALWEAKIHPCHPANTLTDSQIKALFHAIKKVLKLGVKNRGTSLGDGKTNYRDLDGISGNNRGAVKAYGRAGQHCNRCQTPLEKITVAQRGTTFCSHCQKIDVAASTDSQKIS